MGKKQSKFHACESMAGNSDTEPLRVVLIGKTGAGKSSTGNTLLGQKGTFGVFTGLRSGTQNCQWKETLKGDIRLQVTDTPGLCDTHGKEEDILQEIGKSVAVARPGPHVVLMVLKGNDRFTEEEFQAYQTLIQLFGDGIKKFMIVVFVGIDEYGSSLSEQQINFRQEIKRSKGNVTQLFSDANNRVYGVNNKAQGHEFEMQSQMLLDHIKQLWNQNGRHYYNNVIAKHVSELVDQLVQKRIDKGSPRGQAEVDINNDIVEGKVKKNFYKKLGKVVKSYVIPAIQVVVSIGKLAIAAARLDGAGAGEVAERCSIL